MKDRTKQDYQFEDDTNVRIFDQKIATGFIDNKSIQTRRELTDVEPFISLRVRPGQKVVPHPTDYTRKRAKAKAFLESRGINEPVSLHTMFFGDPKKHQVRMQLRASLALPKPEEGIM